MALFLSLGDQLLIYFIEVREFGAVKIIADIPELTGYRFSLGLSQSPVMEVKMVETALVVCVCSLWEFDIR